MAVLSIVSATALDSEQTIRCPRTRYSAAPLLVGSRSTAATRASKLSLADHPDVSKASGCRARRVVVIGGGPAGLMAAQACADAGVEVLVVDGMPSVGRKFLLAGRGGLNLTHSESMPAFCDRYGPRRDVLLPLVRGFDPSQLRAWAESLGVDTFIGSSGRVFPREMKAAPLLRAWLHRLRQAGVRFQMRRRWVAWGTAEGQIAEAAASATAATSAASAASATSATSATAATAATAATSNLSTIHLRLQATDPATDSESDPRYQDIDADAVVLALGGASWARLGSDGRWLPLLRQLDVRVAPLRPANCGFDVGWSPFFSQRFAGTPIKAVSISLDPPSAAASWRRGEFVITAGGVEGSLIYALSAALRDRIEQEGSTSLWLDLLPDRSLAQVIELLNRPRGSRSLSNHLRTRLGIEGVKAGLLREVLDATAMQDSARVAQTLKSLPLKLIAARPIDEAISSAGGVLFDELDDGLMLKRRPGIFCAGEMLDWEAPTGGYLLTACFATGLAAGRAAAAYVQQLPETTR